MDLNFSWSQILTTFIGLFVVIDIVGSIPIIVNLRNKVGAIQSEKATIVASVLLISFLFFGEKLLGAVGVDVESFAIAGALVLFLIAIEMILGIELHKDQEPTTVSIVPIAFPLIAGAGSLTTVLSFRAENQVENIIIGILLNMIIVYLTLKYAGKVERILGPGVISILKKVFGIILMAIAIKMFTTNLSYLLSNIQ